MMARSRNIKPGFFSNEHLAELDFATRLLFIGMWTEADREGRLEDRPRRLKMALFPADNVDIEFMLSGLESFGFMAQTLGTEWGRELVHPQLWVLMAQRRWEAAQAAGEDLVITDVRFENEVLWVKAQGGQVIALERSGAAAVSAHASEQFDISVVADVVISNNGTIDELKSGVDNALAGAQ